MRVARGRLHLTRQTVAVIGKKYSALAKIECHPHRLRHGFATAYLRHNPSDLVGLARLLGHESLDTTARYTVPTIEDLAKRMEA